MDVYNDNCDFDCSSCDWGPKIRHQRFLSTISYVPKLTLQDSLDWRHDQNSRNAVALDPIQLLGMLAEIMLCVCVCVCVCVFVCVCVCVCMLRTLTLSAQHNEAHCSALVIPSTRL